MHHLPCTPRRAAHRRRPVFGPALHLLATGMALLMLAGCAGRELATRDTAPGEGLSLERALILASAEQALGTPYRLGGNTPEALDCSGLVELVYRSAGIAVPRTADDQYRELPEVRQARPGDLLFFGDRRKATHVGIYRGNGQMIHAPGRGREVVSVPLQVAYWQDRFLGAAAPAP